MSSNIAKGRIKSTLRDFLDNEASGGIVLMAAAALAIVTANSPLAARYFGWLGILIGPLSILQWVNDAMMAIFFLLVGLEIKREMLDGQLSSWSRRLLPGAAAAGGMLCPALIFLGLNSGDPSTIRGWAIPTATDIAFALGALSLLGNRVPASLKVFLAALAIIDDLGAVIIIALVYTSSLNLLAIFGASIATGMLITLNKTGVKALWPYLLLGTILWMLIFASGIHATFAGVILAMCIPLKVTPGAPEAAHAQSPLHKLEYHLQKVVAFVVVPVFGFANAGISFTGVTQAVLALPLTTGVAAGLLFGKFFGVLGTVIVLVKLRLAHLPTRASWGQMTGVALLCGIGFTMSLFVSSLAFIDAAAQNHAKIGILMGSMTSGLLGAALLVVCGRRTDKSGFLTARTRS